jgi:hypothetical protein
VLAQWPAIERKLTAQERVDLDLDLRLLRVWVEASSCAFYDPLAWAYLRLAHGLGYLDALSEPRRGQLCRDHGFPVPKRPSSPARDESGRSR